jgi:hypothetical protein
MWSRRECNLCLAHHEPDFDFLVPGFAFEWVKNYQRLTIVWSALLVLFNKNRFYDGKIFSKKVSSKLLFFVLLLINP